jgi:lipooligosaccharide transport system permease protein
VRPSPLPVFRHLFTAYVRTWRGSVFSSFVLPVMFLVGMGLSVGSYVDKAGSLGYPYLDYIAPGLLASTVFQVAFNESTYPVAAGFLWLRTFHAMRASPLRPADILGGEILYIWLRAGASGAGFLVVMTLFGTVHSPMALATIPVSLLLAVASATPVLAYSATIKHDAMFAILFRFLVIPATLFAAVFFPVEQLPAAARWLAYLSPLWHGVELTRAATLGTPTALGWMWHVVFLAAWAVVGSLIARRQFNRRLTD